MAYRALSCPSCGAKIQINDEKAFGFCSYCGEQIMLKDIVEVRHVGLNPAEYRDAALKELYAIRDYLIEKDDKQIKYENAYNKENATKIKDEKEYYRDGVIVIGLIILSMTLAFESSDFLIGLVWFIILLGGAFAAWWFMIKLVPGKASENRAILKKLHENTQKAQKEYDAVKFEYEKPTLNAEYFSIPIVLKLIENIVTGRADTIKEAINVYKDDTYKEEMKQIARDTQKAMEESARAAEEASKSAKQASRVAKANVAISAIDLLLKK